MLTRIWNSNGRHLHRRLARDQGSLLLHRLLLHRLLLLLHLLLLLKLLLLQLLLVMLLLLLLLHLWMLLELLLLLLVVERLCGEGNGLRIKGHEGGRLRVER